MRSGEFIGRGRCVSTLLRFAPLAALTLGMTILSPSASSLPAHEEQVFGDWLLVCVSEQEAQGVVPCEIVQAVFKGDGERLVLRLALAHAGDRDLLGLHMTLPADTRQSGGVIMRLNSEIDFEYAVSSCDGNKCVSKGVLYNDQMLALKAAESGFVATVGGDGSLRRIPISVKGLGAAIEAVTKRNIAWAAMRTDSEAN